MVRKLVSLAIIASMILHCAGRLGVLSYLYEKRHDISVRIGLISEVPIALCSHDYDFSKELQLHEADTNDQVPLNFSVAQEIILFLPDELAFISDNPCAIMLRQKFNMPHTTYKSSYLLDIFHPPSFLS